MNQDGVASMRKSFLILNSLKINACLRCGIAFITQIKAYHLTLQLIVDKTLYSNSGAAVPCSWLRASPELWGQCPSFGRYRRPYELPIRPLQAVHAVG